MASTKFRPLKMAGVWEDTRKAICTICKEEFDSVDAMKKHVLTHAKKDYTCTLCPLIFATFSHLKQHYLLEHEERKAYSCHICKKTFELFSDFQFHLRKHAGEEHHPDTCTVCTTGSEESCDLELHAEAHSLADMNGSNTSIQSTSLKQSKLNKENAPSYVCEECKVVFMKSVEYVKHLLTHKKESYKFFCEFCNKGFTQSAEFEKHLATHEEVNAYVCEYCNEIFKRYSKFEEHLLTHKEKKPQICEICKLAFVQTDEFEKHVLTHKDGKKGEECTGNYSDKVATQCTQFEQKEQKPYVCQACKIAFTQYSEFETHLQTHEEIKTYDCKICNKIFKKCEEFEAHILLHKNNSSSLESCFPTHSNEFEKFLLTNKPSVSHSCESCNEVFTHSKDLKKHKMKCGVREGTESKHKCSICREKFTSAAELQEHILTHGKNKFVCSVCNEQFPLKFLLNKHLQMHKGIHTCEVCSKSFDNSVDLVQHVATHSEEEQKKKESLVHREVTFEDPMVNESTAESCSLMYMPEKPGHSAVTVKKVVILPSVKEEILAKSKRRYKCKVCDKCFTRTSGLKTHLVTHLGRKLYYECKNCAKIFLHKSSRNVHQRIHIKIEHICTICDISFLHSNQFTKHLLTHMREETHKCQICGKSFPQAAELGHHISSHMCQICGDVFEDPVELKLHFLAHTEDRPYSCQVCSTDFVWNSCMDKNTKLDTTNSLFGEPSAQTGNVTGYPSAGDDKKIAKRYLCDICGERFTTSFFLTNHLFNHSGERPFECQFCNRRFSVRSNLKSHNCANTS